MLAGGNLPGNIFGAVTGEWEGVSSGPKKLMGLGINVLVIAIFIPGLSMNLA